jgi:ABC-2 type transport system permease protein
MSQSYSQVRGMLAISKASLRAIFRSPSAVIFGFLFPLIFILVFGFLGNGSRVSIKVSFDPAADTSNEIYRALQNVPAVIVVNKEQHLLDEDLEKGRLSAIVTIKKSADASVPYIVSLKSSDAVNPQNLQVLKSIIKGVINNINEQRFPASPTIAEVNENVEKVPGRIYRTIDFILPGQLGFSLLSAGVFGVAFIFFNMRQTLVLKRFFATPLKRSNILFGEAISRVIFQMITAVVILVIGYFAFHFTLIHGWITFFELLVLSLVGLIVFMGFGFVVSGMAKNESTIPPLANIITLPQFLLAGTFFPIENFPKWLQPFSNMLPLTYLNDAMRNVAFEGAHLSDCWKQLGILGLWGVAVYLVAIKVFKWE